MYHRFGRELYLIKDVVISGGSVLHHPKEFQPTTDFGGVVANDVYTFYRKRKEFICKKNDIKKPLWKAPVQKGDIQAVVFTKNLIIYVKSRKSKKGNNAEMCALDIATGKEVWKQVLPTAIVPWGIAVANDGRIILSCQDGKVLCYK